MLKRSYNCKKLKSDMNSNKRWHQTGNIIIKKNTLSMCEKPLSQCFTIPKYDVYNSSYNQIITELRGGVTIRVLA